MKITHRSVHVNNVLLTSNSEDISAITSEFRAKNTAYDAKFTTIEGADNIIGSILNAIKQSKAHSDSELNAVVTGSIATMQETLTLLTGDDTVVDSVSYKIKQIVGSAPEALNTLVEIAATLDNDANIVQVLKDYADTKIGEAVSTLKGAVSAEMDSLDEIVTAFNSRATAVDQAIADSGSNVLQEAKDYTDSLAVTAGNYSGTITNEKIIFAKAPLDGNVSMRTVRIAIVAEGSPDTVDDVTIRLDATDPTGKTFIVESDTAGEYEALTGESYFLHLKNAS